MDLKPPLLRGRHKKLKLTIELAMQRNTSSIHGLPPHWSAMLDKVQDALKKAEVEARERQRASPWDMPAPDGETEASWQAGMQRLADRISAMKAAMHEQELRAQVVEAELANGENALRQWIEAAQGLQRTMANGVDREVR